MCPKKTGSGYFFHLKKLCVFHQNHLSPSSYEEETDAEQQKKLFDEHRYFCCGYHIFFLTLFICLFAFAYCSVVSIQSVLWMCVSVCKSRAC